MGDTVSFQRINKILELTDSLEINREWVEIPLGAESPGGVSKLDNGKLEIIVDADEIRARTNRPKWAKKKK